MKKFVLFLQILLVIFIFVSCSEIDKSELSELLSQQYSEENYTSQAYSQYVEKRRNAETVMKNDGASENAVKNAVSELSAAINNLAGNKRADFSLLEAALSEKYEEEGYIQSSYEEYRSAYSMALAVYDNKDSRQSAVNSAVKYLRDKINALVKKADTSRLEALLAVKLSEIEYTSSTYSNYRDLYNVAETLLKEVNNPDTVQSIGDLQLNINLCCEQLAKAAEKLVKRGDTSELASLFQRAERKAADPIDGISPELYYTEESLAALKTAIADAAIALQSSNSTQSDIDRVCSYLEDTLDSLVKSDFREALSRTIDEIRNTYLSTREYFTELSYFNLHRAVNEAIDVYNNPKTTKDDVDKSIKKLEEAVDGLVYVILMGTGKTNFIFADTVLRIGSFGIALGKLQDNILSLGEFLISEPNEYVLSFDTSKGEYVLKDSSVFTLKNNGFSLGFSGEFTEESTCMIGNVFLGQDENDIVESIGMKNPTYYYTESDGTTLEYVDSLNGITIKAHYSASLCYVSSIVVEYAGNI